MAITAAATTTLFFGLNLFWFPCYLLFINCFTFLTYGYDKRAARKGKWRVRESRMHLLALLGGSPAALAAQKCFRHKTVKRSFQFTYWAIVILQAVVTVAVLIYM